MKSKYVALLLLISLLTIASCSKKQQEQEEAKPSEPQKATSESTEEPRSKLTEDAGMMELINKHLQHRFTPEVLEVSLSRPATGGETIVTARVENDPELSGDRTRQVLLDYSADGGENWETEIEMEQKDDNLWSALIPAREAGARVLYSIWAEDGAGNVYAEFPCAVSNWPPDGDPCMVPAAVDPEPLDDPEVDVESDLDIWDANAGMDENYFYVHLNVEGKIRGGKLEPFKVNTYSGAILAPEKLHDFDDVGRFTEIFIGSRDALAFMYAPLGPSMEPSFPACSMMYRKDDAPAPETESEMTWEEAMQQIVVNTDDIECLADGSDLHIRIAKSVLGEELARRFVLLGGITVTRRSETDPVPLVRDITHFTTLANVERTFIVK